MHRKFSPHRRKIFFYQRQDQQKWEAEVKYCPTQKMLADFFTKPLQGAWFKYFKEIVMGRVPVKPVTLKDTKMKERDEKHKKGKVY